MRKKVHGVGVNDADYCVGPKVDGKQVRCPFYTQWCSMLERCYSPKFLARYPTYKGCEVDPRWHSFMGFRAWMIKQDWQGKQLDKDLTGTGKLYSPETCVFVPGWLNSLFTDCGAVRGDFPQGVCLIRGRYMAHLSIKGKLKHIGNFDDPWTAHFAYLRAKTKHVRSLYCEIENPRIIEGCERQLHLLCSGKKQSI